ncbi:MAG: caspase domain-containing protein [Bacteroidota bacterium]
MKKTHQVLLIILLSVLASGIQARKIALLVGAGDSPASSRQPLQSEKGLSLMRTTLLKQGFSVDDISIIAGSEATLSGIRNSLETLLNQTGDGDIVVFYFYGHGVQVADDNEDEADKLDEALLPFDGLMTSETEFQHLLLDDEIAGWIHRLRKKTGTSGQILLVVEACHSGSISRGGETNTGNSRYKMTTPTDEEEELAPFVAFYSSMPHQPSLEMKVEDGERIGLLTWAFCKAMLQCDEKSTYRGLFEQTVLYVHTLSYKQTPQIEGTRDMLVFGGTVMAPPPYFKAITSINDRELLLPAGLIQGLRAGSKVVLYPPETRDTSSVTPLAYGQIKADGCGIYESTVLLDSPVSEAEIAAAWVFVRERQFTENSLYVCIKSDDPAFRLRLQQSLSELPGIVMTDTPEGALMISKNGTKLQLQSEEGEMLWETRYRKEEESNATNTLQEQLGNCQQARFLIGLETGESPYKIDFSVQSGSRSGEFSRVGRLRVQRDTAFLKIVNRGQKTIFYSIIDIDSRNRVSVLLPGATGNPADYRLKPGETGTLHRVRFDTPGREVLKLIATPAPVDLRPALAGRRRNYRERNLMEALLNDLNRTDTPKSRTGETYGSVEAGVATVILEVIR